MNPENKIIKLQICFLLFFTLYFVSTALLANELYEDFNNPPNAARPFVRWSWVKSPSEKEIVSQLDNFQKSGFGGVEIHSAETVDSKLFRFAANESKKRGLLIDLKIGLESTLPNQSGGEQSRIIALGKMPLKGPLVFLGDVNELIRQADEAQNIPPDPNGKLMFLRLIQTDLGSFNPGVELLDKIQPDGSVRLDINDSNDYALYVGVLNQQSAISNQQLILDPFNKQTVEKYLKSISAKLNNDFTGIHAVSCDTLKLNGANWTADFNEQFLKRRGYNVTPYLPVILDFNLPAAENRFYDNIRRTRYDYCLTLSELFSERFVGTFTGFCRNNAVLSRFGLPVYPSMLDIYNDFNLVDISLANATFFAGKITFSAAHLFGKPVTSCLFTDFSKSEAAGNLSFVSGVSHFIFESPEIRPEAGKHLDKYARLSYLFQNSKFQAKIAILLPLNDLWSDCGPIGLSPLNEQIWYLSPVWQALNNNGFCVDYISEKILSQATYEDGKLHCGPRTYDLIIIPDVYSMEFPAAKVLRFYAKAGGKIAFVGRSPQTSPGFADLIKRSVPVSMTMDYVRRNDPNRVAYIHAPIEAQNNLVAWAGEVAAYFKIAPDVNIFPVNQYLFFVHYRNGDRDIFFFANIDVAATISFRAEFDTGDKTPWLWDPQTGNRSVFPYHNKKDTLEIELLSNESVLLVFEPNMPQ